MKITQIIGREIYNSRGFPTLECELLLDNSISVTASVPTGTSTGPHEAAELRDGGMRLMGQGVLKAVQVLEQTIAPILIGKEPNVIVADEQMVALDGTDTKKNLGANTILAASIAVCKAQALVEHMHVYELIAHLCEFDMVALPFPMFNVINGGAHASNNLFIQEFMVMPVGVSSFHAALEAGATFFQTLKRLLNKNGYYTGVGDEGGFSANFEHDTQALDYIVEAIEIVKHDFEGSIMIALDVAAGQLYDAQTKMYHIHGKPMSTDKMIELYIQLNNNYPLYAIEDGMAPTDVEGWHRLMEELGSKIQIVGDDLYATSPQRIYEGIEEQLTNTAVVKPNQVGTVTECLQAIKLCKENEQNVIVSHRSGETNDTFIADIAVGTSAGQIKAGGLSRGERMAKFNALLRIEDQLSDQ